MPKRAIDRQARPADHRFKKYTHVVKGNYILINNNEMELCSFFFKNLIFSHKKYISTSTSSSSSLKQSGTGKRLIWQL